MLTLGQSLVSRIGLVTVSIRVLSLRPVLSLVALATAKKTSLNFAELKFDKSSVNCYLAN